MTEMSRRDSVSAKDILAHFQTTYVTSEETVAAAVPLNHQERGWNVVSAFIYLLAVILSVIFHLLIAFESLVIRVIPMLLPSCLTQLPVWKYLQTSDKAWPPPTVVGLAALTVIALIVHPDGHTWVLLRKLSNAMVALLQSSSTCWAIVINDHGAILSSVIALATFAALFFLAYMLRRTLQPKPRQTPPTRNKPPKSKKKKRKLPTRRWTRHRPSEDEKAAALPALLEDKPVDPPLQPPLRERMMTEDSTSTEDLSSCESVSGRSTPTMDGPGHLETTKEDTAVVEANAPVPAVEPECSPEPVSDPVPMPSPLPAPAAMPLPDTTITTSAAAAARAMNLSKRTKKPNPTVRSTSKSPRTTTRATPPGTPSRWEALKPTTGRPKPRGPRTPLIESASRPASSKPRRAETTRAKPLHDDRSLPSSKPSESPRVSSPPTAMVPRSLPPPPANVPLERPRAWSHDTALDDSIFQSPARLAHEPSFGTPGSIQSDQSSFFSSAFCDSTVRIPPGLESTTNDLFVAVRAPVTGLSLPPGASPPLASTTTPRLVKDNPFADDEIEAELQELGGQMIGSILDF